MNKKILWILVANSSVAQIFEKIGGEVKLIQQVAHEKGRKKNRDINTDKPGRTFDRKGEGRHALSVEVDPHSHEQKVFAHELVSILKKAKLERCFDQLAIIAPPKFLGEINLVLPKSIKPFLTVDKDLPPNLNEQKRKKLICSYIES